MPLRIRTIDEVARSLGRDVMFLDIRDPHGRPVADHAQLRVATDWLEKHDLEWEICAAFWPGAIVLEGRGRVVFINTPYLPGSDMLAALDGQFENEDGSPRIPGLILTLLTLGEAQVNAFQDAPQFWDNI